MGDLERVLVRSLTDRDFLERLKTGGVDLEKEFGLDKGERDILENLISAQKGRGLEAFVSASSEAMSRLIPEVRQCLQLGDRPLESRVVPKLERVAAKLDRTAPKLERVAPKLERTAPKLERVAAKIDRAAPKLERAVPKLDRVAPKLERVAPKLDRVEAKLDHIGATLAQIECDKKKGRM